MLIVLAIQQVNSRRFGKVFCYDTDNHPTYYSKNVYCCVLRDEFGPSDTTSDYKHGYNEGPFATQDNLMWTLSPSCFPFDDRYERDNFTKKGSCKWTMIPRTLTRSNGDQCLNMEACSEIEECYCLSPEVQKFFPDTQGVHQCIEPFTKPPDTPLRTPSPAVSPSSVAAQPPTPKSIAAQPPPLNVPQLHKSSTSGTPPTGLEFIVRMSAMLVMLQEPAFEIMGFAVLWSWILMIAAVIIMSMIIILVRQSIKKREVALQIEAIQKAAEPPVADMV